MNIIALHSISSQTVVIPSVPRQEVREFAVSGNARRNNGFSVTREMGNPCREWVSVLQRYCRFYVQTRAPLNGDGAKTCTIDDISRRQSIRERGRARKRRGVFWSLPDREVDVAFVLTGSTS